MTPVRDEAEKERYRADLHARINAKVARALRLPFGSSWHDLDRHVDATMRENDALRAALRELVISKPGDTQETLRSLLKRMPWAFR